MTPAIPRLVSRDPDAKRRHILEAARRLLVAKDLSDIVLDDVARTAGVAKGTLFLYFKNKEDLFSAVVLELAEDLGLELEALSKTGVRGKDLLVAAARAILSHFDRSRDFLGLASAGRLPGCGARSREKVLEKCRANQALVAGLIRAASDDRPSRDPEFAAAAFFGLCRGAAVGRLTHGREGAFEKDAERVVEFFLHGIAS